MDADRADRVGLGREPRLPGSVRPRRGPRATGHRLADVTSAAVLGTALIAMLMGHSYLIAPSMSLRPLLR